jgi:hypothetical protein
MAFGDVCYKCTERYPGCHGKCPRYAEAKAKHNARLETIRKARKEDEDATAVKARAQEKAMRRHNTKR